MPLGAAWEEERHGQAKFTFPAEARLAVNEVLSANQNHRVCQVMRRKRKPGRADSKPPAKGRSGEGLAECTNAPIRVEKIARPGGDFDPESARKISCCRRRMPANWCASCIWNWTSKMRSCGGRGSNCKPPGTVFQRLRSVPWAFRRWTPPEPSEETNLTAAAVMGIEREDPKAKSSASFKVVGDQMFSIGTGKRLRRRVRRPASCPCAGTTEQS